MTAMGGFHAFTLSPPPGGRLWRHCLIEMHMFTHRHRSLIYFVNGLIVFCLVLGGLATVGTATPTRAAGEAKAASARTAAK